MVSTIVWHECRIRAIMLSRVSGYVLDLTPLIAHLPTVACDYPSKPANLAGNAVASRGVTMTSKTGMTAVLAALTVSSAVAGIAARAPQIGSGAGS